MRCNRFLCLVVASALLPLAGCKDPEEVLTHGILKMEMRRAQNQANNPYIGTARVLITASYDECLSNLYESNPDLRQSGREGALVFGSQEDNPDEDGEFWFDRLCEPGTTSKQADCSVIRIEQMFSMTLEQLTVEYAITGDLEGRVLPFGPLPTKETAGCEDPIARVLGNGVKGYNAEGTELWSGSANPPRGVTNQGGELVIEAAVPSD